MVSGNTQLFVQFGVKTTRKFVRTVNPLVPRQRSRLAQVIEKPNSSNELLYETDLHGLCQRKTFLYTES